jgi:hypothetical protein
VVLVGNGNSNGIWTRGHSYYILAKNFSTFYLCPETLSDAEFKSNGLINLAEEISIKHSIQTVVQTLLAAFIQVYRKNWEQQQIAKI